MLEDELIEKYYNDTILPEELNLLQEKLAGDAEFRHRFLLHSQVEVALQNVVMFHNYMDVPNNLEKAETAEKIDEKTEIEPQKESTPKIPGYLNQVLGLAGN